MSGKESHTYDPDSDLRCPTCDSVVKVVGQGTLSYQPVTGKEVSPSFVHARILRVTTPLLAGMFTRGTHFQVIESPIPPGARVIETCYNNVNGTIDLKIEHPDFPAIPEGGEVPIIPPEEIVAKRLDDGTEIL